MTGTETLLKPQDCAVLLVDFQAGLGFGVESIGRQVLINNAVALAKTAVAFGVPVVASTSASRVYSGPLLPALQSALPAVKPIERRNMNVWEDDAARNAVIATNRKRLIVAGLLTEACVSFPVLSALKEGFEVFVVGDTCGDLTLAGHELALPFPCSPATFTPLLAMAISAIGRVMAGQQTQATLMPDATPPVNRFRRS